MIYSIPQDSSVKTCCNTTYRYERSVTWWGQQHSNMPEFH